MPKTASVLIPDGEHELALRVARCLAQQQGIAVHVLSSERYAPLRLSRCTKGFYRHSAPEFDASRVAIIKETAQRIGATIILPVALPTIRLVALHYQELATVAALPPMPPPALLDTFADKWLLAQVLQREDIPYPRTYAVPSAPDEDLELTQHKFPLMVKARSRCAGGGIRICQNAREVSQYLSEQADPSDFFLQEFVTGPDIDVSVLCRNGEILAYTIQRGVVPSPKPFHPPAAIEFIQDAGVLKSIQRLVRATEWSGIAHFDCIYDLGSRETKLLEANPRYWRSLLGSLKAGVNFPHLACLASTGEQFERPAYRNIRYARPEAALRLWTHRWLKRGSTSWSLRDSAFSLILRDPLPDVAIQARRLSKRGKSYL
jgi:D-aspartate ligase